MTQEQTQPTRGIGSAPKRVIRGPSMLPSQAHKSTDEFQTQREVDEAVLELPPVLPLLERLVPSLSEEALEEATSPLPSPCSPSSPSSPSSEKLKQRRKKVTVKAKTVKKMKEPKKAGSSAGTSEDQNCPDSNASELSVDVHKAADELQTQREVDEALMELPPVLQLLERLSPTLADSQPDQTTIQQHPNRGVESPTPELAMPHRRLLITQLQQAAAQETPQVSTNS